MATAAEVIQDALLNVVVGAAESGIEAAEAQAAIRGLNDMMTQWDVDGIKLGYTKVSSLGDEVTVPDGALLAIKTNLGITISPQYQGIVSAALVKLASDSKATATKLAVFIGKSALPDTLPVGSGNRRCNGHRGRRFFPSTAENDLLTEQNGSILLEDDTDV